MFASFGMWAALVAGATVPAWPSAPLFAAQSPRLALAAGLEVRRDRLSYRFESPSSFGTASLVPHFFTQSYHADMSWLVVSARYRVSKQAWFTELALAPETVAFGDDFDTFFQPDGDIATVGTAGDVSLRSLRLEQRFIALPRGPLTFVASYVYRRDRARFHPADRVARHTRPPSETREFITTRETTISSIHELRVGAQVGGALGRVWRVDADVAVTPTALARLVTKLPDKYPGLDITFAAIGFSAGGRVALRREAVAWFVEVGAEADGLWSYLSDRQCRREGFGATARIGWRR